MRKIIFKSFIGSMILLFCIANVQAQYTVFKVKGTVEVSANGEMWNPLKKKDELKTSHQIRMLDNSLVEIVDSQNVIYHYANTKIVSVGDIVKQKSSILDMIHENPGIRKAFGGAVRSDGTTEPVETPKGVYAIFTDTETSIQYDSSDAIPVETVFFITICNATDEDKMINVYQKLENEKTVPCFPKDIFLEKNTAVDIKDVLFGKQGNNHKFAIHHSNATQNAVNDFRKQFQQEYDAFKKQATKEYNDFRDKANAEYAEFMRQAWKEFYAEPPIPIPPSPDPPKPPVFKPDGKPSNDSIPLEAVVPAVVPVIPPQPVAPIPETPLSPDAPPLSFSFYHTDCKVRLDTKQKINLPNISEKTIANAWETLSKAAHNPTITDCLHLREQLSLSDWGYYQLVQTMADKYYGADNPNESILFQIFILTQSGYKLRIARTDDSLVILIPFDHTIYTYSYMAIDGHKFYVLDKKLRNGKFYICDYSFPKEQVLSLQINALPKFNQAQTTPKIFTSANYPVKVEIQTNKNLIDFFNSYPVSSEWNLYAKASLSEQVKNQLYPVLKNSIDGKSQRDAANMLINFVQTAFVYQTDEEQFGYERPFFGDEIFYYPASDCEDRAILFSILVRELLGLDVVLLHYPNHLATAIRFNENIEGDYVMVNAQKYIVCDPTYIGAGIGREMPASARPKVVKI